MNATTRKNLAIAIALAAALAAFDAYSSRTDAADAVAVVGVAATARTVVPLELKGFRPGSAATRCPDGYKAALTDMLVCHADHETLDGRPTKLFGVNIHRGKIVEVSADGPEKPRELVEAMTRKFGKPTWTLGSASVWIDGDVGMSIDTRGEGSVIMRETGTFLPDIEATLRPAPKPKAKSANL